MAAHWTAERISTGNNGGQGLAALPTVAHRTVPARRMSRVPRRISHIACRASHPPRPQVARRASHVRPCELDELPTFQRCALLPYRGNHPRPPPNKYNASIGQKCVANAHATFFVTFDDFRNSCVQIRCNLLVQGLAGTFFSEYNAGQLTALPAVAHFSTGTLAEQTLGPPATIACFSTGNGGGEGSRRPTRPFPRGTAAHTEVRPASHRLSRVVRH